MAIDECVPPDPEVYINRLGNIERTPTKAGPHVERVFNLSYEYIGNGQCQAVLYLRFLVSGKYGGASSVVETFRGPAIAWASPLAFRLARHFEMRIFVDAEDYGKTCVFDPVVDEFQRTFGNDMLI